MDSGSKKIYKFPLKPELTRLMIPANAQILCVQVHCGIAYLWVLLDPVQPLVSRTFCIYGAKHEIKEKLNQYIGTFQLLNGALVLHVFEVHSVDSNGAS